MSYQNVVRGITLAIAAAAAWTVPTIARQRPAPAATSLTAADYAHAEKFMTWNTTPLVFQSGVSPTWLPDDRFWYRITTPAGNGTILVNPATAEKQPCTLPACVASGATTARGGGAGRGRGGRGGRGAVAVPSVMAPDGTHAVFVRDWNLWVRDTDSGKETQLTTDGVKDFGYATDNAGWSNSDRPIVVWSPDSKKIATFQQDQRGVGEMYLVSTQVGHPQLQAWKYPLPGDDDRRDVAARRHRSRISEGDPAQDARRISIARRSATTWRAAAATGVMCSGRRTRLQWPSPRHRAITGRTVLRVADAVNRQCA